MLDNFWLAKCVQLLDFEVVGKLAKCNECKLYSWLTPDVEGSEMTEAVKAHIFRTMKHAAKCKAYRLYLEDSAKSEAREKKE